MRPPPLSNPWYYLDNFERVLRWVAGRYADLLLPDEHAFIAQFLALAPGSRGLLVRMIMRKGLLFRASKLSYTEIGDPGPAAHALIDHQWLNNDPLVTVDELCGQLTRNEVMAMFGTALTAAGARSAKKPEQIDVLCSHFPEAQRHTQWHSVHPSSTLPQLRHDTLYALSPHIIALCDRFRLMFFGNLRQSWTDFVLADLGLYVFEQVSFPPSARAFQARQDIDDYLYLHYCREQFDQASNSEQQDALFHALPNDAYQNEWLETRRARLLYHMGKHYERQQNWASAGQCYQRSSHAEARQRLVRVLERSGQSNDALALAQLSLQAPHDEAEQQQVLRMLPRLLRQCGQPAAAPKPANITRIDLALPLHAEGPRVEEAVRQHLHSDDAPAFYVENTLINALFGLLCWDAVFAAVPGAFFNPYQRGPADLLRSGFHQRRQSLFDVCLGQLDNERYLDTIRSNFARKQGIQSPFVAWQAINPALLDLALSCMPPQHLRVVFERLLRDIPGNRSGLPDLIQFWPNQQHYQLIEVKGPGDRLQDNQIRWLNYCAAHGIDAMVCHVQRVAA
ncbi:VRR-NUC domain-containing protein [Pusillimonas sp. ANT_WB101]|uniref:VRR-NUC domain-containing protein n=1 Tax=Pusillimonas sp. ANT_WB101 TaxID=2597356 RepID=UPI0011EF4756|nr:VRR-NUC domain-containing protein [Pusillimonas sp. ANT_WB101]KAA0911552.1 VRR-NUC domain-containing protein [Pusillimonas sp. ANT_WB101]